MKLLNADAYYCLYEAVVHRCDLADVRSRLVWVGSTASLLYSEQKISSVVQGCFWGVENYFNKHFKDAILKSEVLSKSPAVYGAPPPSQSLHLAEGICAKLQVGYTGGEIKNPDYRKVQHRPPILPFGAHGPLTCVCATARLPCIHMAHSAVPKVLACCAGVQRQYGACRSGPL